MVLEGTFPKPSRPELGPETVGVLLGDLRYWRPSCTGQRVGGGRTSSSLDPVGLGPWMHSQPWARGW